MDEKKEVKKEKIEKDDDRIKDGKEILEKFRKERKPIVYA